LVRLGQNFLADPNLLEAIVADAQMVLNEQVRNSILQVVHR